MSYRHSGRRAITVNDIQFVHNWIRQNLETMPGCDTPFFETYEDYCSSCHAANVTPVAKNCFGPIILKEFPDSYPNPKNHNRKTVQYYHNIIRKQESDYFSFSDGVTTTFNTLGATSGSVKSLGIKDSSNNSLSSPQSSPTNHDNNHNAKEMTSLQESDFLFNNTFDNRNNDESRKHSFTQVSLASSSSLSTNIHTGSFFEYTNTHDFPDDKNNSIIAPSSYVQNESDETIQVSPPLRLPSPFSPHTSGTFSDESQLQLTTGTECYTLGRTVAPIIQNEKATITAFFRLYERYCDNMLHLLQTEQFHAIEECMIKFHQELPKEYQELIQDKIQEITESICQWDLSFYETITASFYSTMSHSPITSCGLVSALETYIKQLNIYLNKALVGYPLLLRDRKLEVARDFASAMYRHIKLTQLAELAATSLDQDEEFLKYIQAFWKNTDISFIIDHASRYIAKNCDFNQIKTILVDEVGSLFLHYSDKANLQQWIAKMELKIEEYMDSKLPDERKDSEFYRFCGDHFILRWTFYTTRILEEVTLTKTNFLGKFSELVLFLNELIQFLVDSSVTKMTRAI